MRDVQATTGNRHDAHAQGGQADPAAMQRLARTVDRQDREIRSLRGAAYSRQAHIKTFPPCCPVVRQNIREDIPEGRQYIVRMAFLGWCLGCCAFVLNVVVVALQLFAGSNRVIAVFLALLFACLGIPLSWVCWYSAVYMSQITDAGTAYFGFFIQAAVHELWSILAIVGPKLGSAGAPLAGFLSLPRAAVGGGSLLGLTMVNTALWLLSFLAVLTVYKWTFYHFRRGASDRAAAGALY